MSAIGRGLLRGPLALVAAGYRVAIRLRNRRYDRPGVARRAPVPVVSVGNLTVGGTGKTPLVAWLATRLLAAGRRPAVVSRGYGGRAGRGPRVVSRGAGALCDAATAGDEPFLLATMLAGTVVVVGSDRPAGAAAAAELGADLVLLDDGFQHRRLARDLDIVLLDATDPFGGGRLLPAGRLREPVDSLRRADLVVITRCLRDGSTTAIEAAVREQHASVPVLRAGHRAVGFFDGRGSPVTRPGRIVAFCGIGNPERFREDLERAGVVLAAFETYRDHHPFDVGEVARLRARARDLGAALVTTDKDRVRLPGNTEGILTLRIEADPFEPDELVSRVLEAVARGGG